jgi:hypothetical protein
MRNGLNAFFTGYLHKIETREAAGVTMRTLVMRLPQKNRDGQPVTGWFRVRVPKNADVSELGDGDQVELEAWASWQEWTAKDGAKRAEWSWMLSRVVDVQRQERRDRGGEIPF